MEKPTLHTDSPIQRKIEDSLGRKEFAQNVAKAISNSTVEQGSFVMGLYGEWGAGKTSVINMIYESLNEQEDKDKAPIIVRFSPWYFSGQDQLFEQFFLQLASEIRSFFAKAQDGVQDMAKKAGKAADTIIKLSNMLRPIKYAAPLIGIPSGAIDVGINSIQATAKQIKGHADAVTELNANQSFDPQGLKTKISKALSDLDRKVLIIIDDIDRLTKEEVRQIFQLVKALADFKNTIYLLSFDPKEICAALKEVQTDHPDKYLEKIVQIPFELPTLSPTKIFTHLTNSLNNIITEEDWSESIKKHWESLCYYGFRSYFTNLREVARFLNLCQFNYALLKEEVNLVDLWIMTAINIRQPALYRFIKDNKHIFCGTKTESLISVNQEEHDKIVKAEYEEFCEQNHDIKKVEPLLKELFPYLGKILSESAWSDEPDQRDLAKHKHIASEKHFDRFFSMSVPDGQISDQVVHALIALQSQPKLLLERMQEYSYAQQQELIDTFYTHKDKFQADNYVCVTEALMPLAENIDESDYHGFFSIPSLSDYIQDFIKHLFASNDATDIDKLERYTVLFKSDLAGAYMMSALLWDIMDIVGVRDSKGNFNLKLINHSYYKVEFKILEELLVAKIKKLAEENSLQYHRKMIRILYAWWRVKPDAAKDYANRFIKTKKGLIEFITASVGCSYSSRDGKVPRIHWNNIADFVTDTESLVQRVENIKNSQDFEQLNEKQKIAINALLHSAKNPNQDIL